jgi:hypothetical protein
MLGLDEAGVVGGVVGSGRAGEGHARHPTPACCHLYGVALNLELHYI